MRIDARYTPRLKSVAKTSAGGWSANSGLVSVSMTLDTLFAMKPHWRVSVAALIMRAGQLGRVTERQKKYLWMQMSARGYRHDEPIAIDREEPALVAELVQAHVSDLEATFWELRDDGQTWCLACSRRAREVQPRTTSRGRRRK